MTSTLHISSKHYVSHLEPSFTLEFVTVEQDREV